MLAGAAKLYHAAHTRRVPRRVCTASGKVATEFQSDSSRTDSPVRILHAQPRSRVSVARLSRSWALRAAPFALTGAQVGQSGLTDLGERSANKSRVSPGCCARGSHPPRCTTEPTALKC